MLNTLSYTLLSLLARETYSGYDLMIYLKKHLAPFWPVSHTQIYPALALLEEGGLVTHHIVEHYATRPDKKVYQITPVGSTVLQQWVESPTSLTITRDEFYVKAYSLWLAEPKRMVAQFRQQIQLHKEQLELHEQVLDEKLSVGVTAQAGDDLTALTQLMFQYKIGYEQNYINWCQSALEYLEQNELANQLAENENTH